MLLYQIPVFVFFVLNILSSLLVGQGRRVLRIEQMLAGHLREPLLDFLEVSPTCLLPGPCLAVPALFVQAAALALEVDHYHHPNQAVSALKVLSVTTSTSVANVENPSFS